MCVLALHENPFRKHIVFWVTSQINTLECSILCLLLRYCTLSNLGVYKYIKQYCNDFSYCRIFYREITNADTFLLKLFVVVNVLDPYDVAR